MQQLVFFASTHVFLCENYVDAFLHRRLKISEAKIRIFAINHSMDTTLFGPQIAVAESEGCAPKALIAERHLEILCNGQKQCCCFPTISGQQTELEEIIILNSAALSLW